MNVHYLEYIFFMYYCFIDSTFDMDGNRHTTKVWKFGATKHYGLSLLLGYEKYNLSNKCLNLACILYGERCIAAGATYLLRTWTAHKKTGITCITCLQHSTHTPQIIKIVYKIVHKVWRKKDPPSLHPYVRNSVPFSIFPLL